MLSTLPTPRVAKLNEKKNSSISTARTCIVDGNTGKCSLILILIKDFITFLNDKRKFKWKKWKAEIHSNVV